MSDLRKSKEEIAKDILDRLEAYTDKRIAKGSAIDFYTKSISDIAEDIYEEIQKTKNPFLYSSLRGKNLDDLGYLLDLPRGNEESDNNYLYRLMNWKYSAESSNLTAIDNALLNTEWSSSSFVLPLTLGSGTASVYIIPINYEDETVSNAINETKEIVEEMSSPSSYIEYIIPEPTPVILNVSIQSRDGDFEKVKSSIEEKVRDYVNNVPPEQYLNVGEINKIGVNEQFVDYFSTLRVYINEEEYGMVSILQELDKKFILDEIIWNEEGGE